MLLLCLEPVTGFATCSMIRTLRRGPQTPCRQAAADLCAWGYVSHWGPASGPQETFPGVPGPCALQPQSLELLAARVPLSLTWKSPLLPLGSSPPLRALPHHLSGDETSPIHYSLAARSFSLHALSCSVTIHLLKTNFPRSVCTTRGQGLFGSS